MNDQDDPPTYPEKIIPIPRESMRGAPPEEWQQHEDGSWELGGSLRVELLDGAWRVRYWIDDGPLWGTKAAAMMSYECWSAALGGFATADIAKMVAEDDGLPSGCEYDRNTGQYIPAPGEPWPW